MDQIKPLVSIIIPCFNGERFLARTLESCQSQTYENLEIILVDDGSTDSSNQIAKGFEGVRVIEQKNKGVSSARNNGIKNSNAEYLAFLDADDILLKNSISLRVNFLEENKEYPLVHGFEERVDENEAEIEIEKGQDGHVSKKLLQFREKVIHSPSSVMVRSRVVEEIGGFNEKLSTSADWEFWLRLSKKGPFGMIPEPINLYRTHTGQMHLNVDAMAKDMHQALSTLRPLFKDIPEAEWSEYVSNINFTIAASYIGDQKKILGGIKYSLKSFLSSPKVFSRRIRKSKNVFSS